MLELGAAGGTTFARRRECYLFHKVSPCRFLACGSPSSGKEATRDCCRYGCSSWVPVCRSRSARSAAARTETTTTAAYRRASAVVFNLVPVVVVALSVWTVGFIVNRQLEFFAAGAAVAGLYIAVAAVFFLYVQRRSGRRNNQRKGSLHDG